MNNARILQLNSMLTGGGTDDQCVKLVSGLHLLRQNVSVAGPDGQEFSQVIRKLALPFHVTPPEGPLKIRFILQVAKLIRREKITIVHGHHGRDIWPTFLAARISGAKPKIILTRHMAKSPRSALSRRLMLGQCDALVAVSHFVARVLREGVYEPDSPTPERHSRPPVRGNLSKIHVVHGGIDTDRFFPFDAAEQRREWGLAATDYAIGMAGAYDLPRGKGQREFLQAAASIHQEVPNARFLIIGRGNMVEVLQADIARLGLAGKALMVPYSHDMPRTMNALDCLVHSQVGTEAFGLVVVEAFACGRPVIASALDGIPEAFAAANYGQLVKPDSVEELAGAMRQWAVKPGLSMTERQALHQRVTEEFSVRAFAERMVKLYDKILCG